MEFRDRLKSNNCHLMWRAHKNWRERISTSWNRVSKIIDWTIWVLRQLKLTNRCRVEAIQQKRLSVESNHLSRSNNNSSIYDDPYTIIAIWTGEVSAKASPLKLTIRCFDQKISPRSSEHKITSICSRACSIKVVMLNLLQIRLAVQGIKTNTQRVVERHLVL